jgi:hypothetical protein
MLKIVAHAQDDNNSFCCISDQEMSRIARAEVSLEVMSRERGVERVMSNESFDLLVVDFYSGRYSPDIVTLCREKHPNAKVVMHNEPGCHRGEESKYDAIVSVYNHKDVVSALDTILRKTGLMTDFLTKAMGWKSP